MSLVNDGFALLLRNRYASITADGWRGRIARDIVAENGTRIARHAHDFVSPWTIAAGVALSQAGESLRPRIETVQVFDRHTVRPGLVAHDSDLIPLASWPFCHARIGEGAQHMEMSKFGSPWLSIDSCGMCILEYRL